MNVEDCVGSKMVWVALPWDRICWESSVDQTWPQRLALLGGVSLLRPPTNPHIARTSVEVEWNILWWCAYAHRPCIGGVILLILGSTTQSAMRKRDYIKDAVHFTCRAIRELLDQGMADRAVLVWTRSSRLETVLAKEPNVRLDT